MKAIHALVWLLLAAGLQATTLPTLSHLVSGTLQAEGEPLEYATVSAFNPAGELVEGTVTDASGYFALQLEDGTYRLLFEFIGYAEQEQELEISEATDLGIVSLGQSSIALDEVTVTAERSQLVLDLDKKVFNLGQDIISQGGSANEVLEQLPSVTVSAEGVVSLRGNSGVRVLINGRPSALANNNALESIPAESIERVEIITNPSARYEAAGTAGIINIILKKERAGGHGGSLSVGAGYPADHRLNLNLNLRRTKLTAFLNGGLRYSNYFGRTELSRLSQIPITLNSLRQNTDQDRNDIAGNVYTGVDLQLNESTNLAINYSLYSVINDDEERIDYDFLGEDNELERGQFQFRDYLEPGNYHQLDFSLMKEYANGGQLNFYFRNDLWLETETESIQLDETFPDRRSILDYRTRTEESSRDHMLQLDYEKPLGESGRFELGARAETRVISADYLAENGETGTYIPMPGFINDYDYFERIGSAYIQFRQQWGKLGVQLGLRNEYTFIRTENSGEAELGDLEKDYNRLFPSASFSYQWSDQTSAQLSYSRRIRRPSFWQLNPFAGLRDPNQLFIGNPDIDPAYTDRVELNFLQRFEKLTINPAIYGSRTIDFFQVYVEQVPENLFDLEAGTVLERPINLDREYQYGLELSVQYRPTDAINLSGEVNVFGYRQEGQFEEQNFDFDFLSWSSGLRMGIELPAEFEFQARVSYNAATESAQIRQLAIVNADFGLSKAWGEQFSMSLNVRGPRYRFIEGRTAAFEQRIRSWWTGWRTRLTATYRFERGAESRARRARGSIR